MSAQTVSVRLLAEIQGYISPLKQATQATKDFRKELATAAQAGKLDAVVSMATGAGLALVGGFAAATMAAARFDKQMSEVAAVAGASASELERLSEAALQAGKDTVFSATEAAKAEAELAKAGLTTADILGGALRGSLDLAAAGGLDLAEAADVAAKAMNIFNLQGADVAHIADVLAAAANKSATDVHELGFALRMGGLAAKNSGVGLEETVGTLAAFADNALTGSDAGTSFKTMLQMLAAPSGEATKKMEELGIAAYDAQGNFIGIAKLAGVLQKQMKDLTQEQRNEALATIFGADAMRAATVLYGEGEKGIREYTDAVNDQGAAQEMAAKKTDNLMGDIERLTGSLETLFITSGEGANGGLRLLVQGVTELVDGIGSLPAPVLTVGTMLVGLAGGGLLAFSAFVKARGAFGDALTELRDMGPAGGRAANGLQRLSAFAGRAAISLTAVAVAGRLITAATSSAVNANMAALSHSLLEFAESGHAAGEAGRLFGKDLEDLNYDLQVLSSGGLQKFGIAFAETMEGIGGEGPGSQSVSKARERLAALDQSLAELASNGHAREAAEAFKRVWVEAQAQGISLQDLQAGFPAYIAAAAEAAKAETALASSTSEVNRAQVAAVESGQTLVDLWDELHGAAKSADEQMLDAIEATHAITAAFEENGSAVRGNTEAALKNRIALEDGARKAYEAAEAYLVNGGSAEGAKKILDKFRKSNEDAAVAAGGNRQKVRELNDALYAMPAKVTTKVSVITSLDMSTLPDFVRKSLGMRWGGVRTVHAQTGLLREAATYSPTAPARYAFAEPATGGEAFVPKNGNYGRSMSILNQAAGWYGAAVVPRGGWYGGQGGGGGGGPVTVNGTITVVGGDSVSRAVAENMRVDVWASYGGDSQSYLGPRSR